MNKQPLLWSLATAGLLTACGGGGSSTGSTPAVIPSTTDVTLAGVVSTGTGTPAASRNVVAKCATGSGSDTTIDDGTYHVTVSAAALPCLLEAVLADGTELHSVATGTGSTATANINPVTELVVANLSGTNTSTYYDNFNSSAAASVTSTSVNNAVTAITLVLTAAGVSTSALGNPVTATVDSGYTTALGSLGTALSTGGTTVAELSTTVANSSVQSTGTTNNTASLPAELLVRASASNCAALRAGTYRFVKFSPSSVAPTATGPVITTDTGTINPTAMTVTWSDNSVDAVTASGNCHYTIETGVEFAVSPAGVIVGRDNWNVITDSASSTYWAVIGFPLQNIALSELAGNWNAISWNTYPAFDADAYKFTVDSSGLLTSAGCVDQPNPITLTDAQCNTVALPGAQFSANSTGGFNMASTNAADPWSSRAFAYRAGDGNLMVVVVNAQGEMDLYTRPRTLGTPTVNDTVSSWTVQIDATGVSPVALAQTSHTIVSVDAVNKTYTRRSEATGGGATHIESLQNNVARNGYFHRTGETVNDSNNNPVTVREFYGLNMASFGITPAFLPASGSNGRRFQISVRQ